MFSEKFQELEAKIHLTAELVAHLKLEKSQLERKHQEAEQRIAALEEEIKRLQTEGHTLHPSMDRLTPQLNSRPENSQDPAIHQLTEVLGKEPNNTTALFELGNLYERQGMYEQAIQEYRKALNVNADFVDAIEHLAFLLEKLNRDHEASPLWERILSLKKRD